MKTTALPKQRRTLSKESKRSIFAWCVYDWAINSFSVIVTTFVIAAYFTRHIAPNEIIGTALWGYTIAFTGLLIAIFSPIFGAIADHTGRRKPWLLVFTMTEIIASAALWFAMPSSHFVAWTLMCVALGTLGIEFATVFYNSMLPEIAPRRYIGRISGWGWGLGYAGGLTSLTIVLFAFILPDVPLFHLDKSLAENVRICGPLVAVWIMLFSIPMFAIVPDRQAQMIPKRQAIVQGVKSFFATLKVLPKHKNISLFLIARMLYMDGINTIFVFGGIYAAGTFNMSVAEVIEFGIFLNIAAGIGAGLFAWLDDIFGPKRTIQYSLVGIITSSFILLLVKSKLMFWIFALSLGSFVGPVQASSRSLMARLAPPTQMTELFGLYAFSGKATAYVGPWLLGLVTVTFNSQRVGMSTVLIFMIAGFSLFWYVTPPRMYRRHR